MAFYNITTVPGSLVYSKTNSVPGDMHPRNALFVYNIMAQPGLAVGDTVFVYITVPPWARRAWCSKRTDTLNADTFFVEVSDPTMVYTALAPAGVTGTSASAYANSATNAAQHIIPVSGDLLRVGLTIVNSLPATARVWVCFYDT